MRLSCRVKKWARVRLDASSRPRNARLWVLLTTVTRRMRWMFGWAHWAKGGWSGAGRWGREGRRTCGRVDRPCPIRVEQHLGAGHGWSGQKWQWGAWGCWRQTSMSAVADEKCPKLATKAHPRQAHRLAWHESAFGGPIWKRRPSRLVLNGKNCV